MGLTGGRRCGACPRATCPSNTPARHAAIQVLRQERFVRTYGFSGGLAPSACLAASVAFSSSVNSDFFRTHFSGPKGVMR